MTTAATQTARGEARPETVISDTDSLVCLLARIAARSCFVSSGAPEAPLADPALPVRRDPALSIPHHQEVPACATT